jgi:hypothetical protein
MDRHDWPIASVVPDVFGGEVARTDLEGITHVVTSRGLDVTSSPELGPTVLALSAAAT